MDGSAQSFFPQRFCRQILHQVTYRCGVVAPEASHNWEERVLISQRLLRTIVSHMWVGDWAIEKLDLDFHLVVCAHPLKQYCRRLLFIPQSFRENHKVTEREGDSTFSEEIMLLSATATLWKTSWRMLFSLQKGKTPISLSGDREWHTPWRSTGNTGYAFVPVDNRACRGGVLSFPWACNGLS